MNTSEQILVIILSVALAVLLVLAIVVTIQVIRLLKAVNRITDKAEHVIENAEHVAKVFSNASSSLGGMAIFRIVKNVVDIATSVKSGKSKKK